MATEISKYWLISDLDPDSLTRRVNDALQAGWEPYGSAQPSGNAGSEVYTQTMVKKAFKLEAKDKAVFDLLDGIGDGGRIRGWVPLNVWKEKADAKFVHSASFKASVKVLVDHGLVLDDDKGNYRVNPNSAEDLL